jgi:hypothetical protein
MPELFLKKNHEFRQAKSDDLRFLEDFIVNKFGRDKPANYQVDNDLRTGITTLEPLTRAFARISGCKEDFSKDHTIPIGLYEFVLGHGPPDLSLQAYPLWNSRRGIKHNRNLWTRSPHGALMLIKKTVAITLEQSFNDINQNQNPLAIAKSSQTRRAIARKSTKQRKFFLQNCGFNIAQVFAPHRA